MGDEINPANQNGEPRFNRPEDAEGFLQSQGAVSQGVEADAESARRQREELMYWNAIHLEKLAREGEKRPEQAQSRGSSFEDFLQEDPNAEKGTTFVYNTGADAGNGQEEGLRNRGSAASGVRGLQRGSVWANPFGDEHNIDMDEQRAIDASLMSPDASEKYEVLSEGLYSANEDHISPPDQTMAELLIDTTVPEPLMTLPQTTYEEPEWSHQDLRSAEEVESAFASIHAWADNANNSFYSPLPTTPRALSPIPAMQLATPGSPTLSDPLVSVPAEGGDATPTDSMSLAGSGDEVWAPRSGATSDADVLSVDGDGISTPGTWTEVGSVVSENDAVIH